MTPARFFVISTAIVFAIVLAPSARRDACIADEVKPTTRPISTQPAKPPLPGKVDAGIFDDSIHYKRVSFVIDIGSLMQKAAGVQDQLIRAIIGLEPDQSFGIIYLKSGQYEQLNKEFLPATPANKRKAAAFMDNMSAIPSADPIPGIEAAFKQNPEVIHLLTAADFPDNDAVLKKFRELNLNRKVIVNTLSDENWSDGIDTTISKLLKTIAQENGGRFRRLRETDF